MADAINTAKPCRAACNLEFRRMMYNNRLFPVRLKLKLQGEKEKYNVYLTQRLCPAGAEDSVVHPLKWTPRDPVICFHGDHGGWGEGGCVGDGGPGGTALIKHLRQR